MPKMMSTVSDEDIRRKYYESAGYSMWITEMQLDPLQLVVCDDSSGKYFRVPVTLAGGEFTFGGPVEVAVQYVDTTKARASVSWGSRGDSLQGIGTPLVDREALARAVDAVTVAGQRDPIRQVGNTLETPAQAAARIHAAAQRAAGATPDTTPVTGPSSTEGGSVMPQAYDPVKIREALGLGPTATDPEVETAWAAAFGKPAPATVPPAAPGTTDPTPTPAPTPPTPTPAPGAMGDLAKLAKAMGVTIIDPSQLAAMQNMAAQGKQAYDKQRADERDGIIEKAVAAGKIELSRVPDWQRKWDADPEGARQTLDALAPNMVPMTTLGYAGSMAVNEGEQRHYDLYPEDKPQGGGRRV